MIARYQTLARRIQLEIEELERTQAVIERHWQTARRTTTDPDAYLNSVCPESAHFLLWPGTNL